MTDEELEALLLDLESDRVERKESLAADKDRLCQAICAFSNDLPGNRRPGVLFIGVKDDGSPAGLPVTDRLLLDLSGIRSDGNILPLPVMTVQKRAVAGTDVAVVVVEPSETPPVRYKGRTWVRVGPRRAIATAEEERRLAERRRAGDLPFDARPLPSSSLQDLDLRLFEQTYLPSALDPEVLKENDRSAEQQLAASRFLSPDGVPTAAGVLVLGSQPTRFIPGAYVQMLRIDGATLADPIKDEKRFDDPLPELLRLVEEVLQINIATAVSVESFGEPGLTDYRNPTLAEAMRALGYVQRFGVGIPVARAALAGNGNPPPEFDVNDRNVLVTVRSRS